MFRLLKQMRPPCVPYFGTIQKLFANMDESNPIHPREHPQLIDLDRLRTIYSIMEIFHKKHEKSYSIKVMPRLYFHLQEMNILSPDQLASYSLKCEEPITHPTTHSSLAQDSEVAKPYKLPPANHWTTEVQRIWSKPFEQLPIGIDLPRLATSICVGSCPDPAFRHYTIPALETRSSLSTSVASQVDEVDTHAREIMDMLVELAKLVDSDDYANIIQQNFKNYIVLEGVKDRDMSREIASLFEYLGKDCKIAKVLKAINQAIIAPPIIELTLNVCAKLPFRDAGGWRIYVHRHENQLTVTHAKKQKARSYAKEDEFEFEWRLEIVFGEDPNLDTLSHINLKVTDIGYGEMLSQTKKSEVENMLSSYAW